MSETVMPKTNFTVFTTFTTGKFIIKGLENNDEKVYQVCYLLTGEVICVFKDMAEAIEYINSPDGEAK